MNLTGADGVVAHARRAWHRRPVRWGRLRRLPPISDRWGYDRGTPIDRHYIERFLQANVHRIRGRALEVKDSGYTSRLGSATHLDVVDIDPTNRSATIVVDLSTPGSLPAEAFDCAVITQTLMYVGDLGTAIANLWQSLRPGGSLLVTTTCIGRVDDAAQDRDRWHLTPRGVEDFLRAGCPGGSFEVRGYGNTVAAIAFLHGLAAEELTARELDHDDPLYPIVVAAVVDKPPTGG